MSGNAAEGFYHLHVKNIGRRFGRSVVAAAAYRAGETLRDEAEERDSKFGGRRDVVHAELRLPATAPMWAHDRERLWNAVEAAEKRTDARLAKEIEFSIPRELPRAQWVAVAREMADAYASDGLPVDLAIHEDGREHNPHVHLLIGLRPLGADGLAKKKNRDVDTRQFVIAARKRWESIANAALGQSGSAVQIDARSYKERGVDRPVGRHRGPDPLERREGRRLAAAVRENRMADRGEVQAVHTMLREEAFRRFPALHRRDDWPPVDRNPPLDLSSDERPEFDAFWREVDERREELTPRYAHDRHAADMIEGRAPAPAPERVQLDPRALERGRQSVEQLAPVYDADRAETRLNELWSALQERMNADGRVVDPVWNKEKWEAAFDDFRSQLAEVRAIEEQNRLYRERDAERERKAERLMPVPDNQRDLVPAVTLEEAQERMIEEMEQPARDLPELSVPERVPADEVPREDMAAARAENERIFEQEQDEGPAWLRRLHDVEATPAPEPEQNERPAWLDRLSQQPSREEEREPERDRER